MTFEFLSPKTAYLCQVWLKKTQEKMNLLKGFVEFQQIEEPRSNQTWDKASCGEVETSQKGDYKKIFL